MLSTPKNFRLICITSADENEIKSTQLRRLFVSGRNVVDRWILVLRNIDALTDEVSEYLPKDTILVHTGAVGISRARNDGLVRLRMLHEMDAHDIVVFPDSDAWFGPLSRNRIADTFFNLKSPDLCIAPYGPSDAEVDRMRWPSKNMDADSAMIPRVATSAGLAIRGDVLVNLGYFDERLGVGTPRASGEDVELALRAYIKGHRIAYRGMPFLYHAYYPERIERRIGGVSVIRAYSRHLGLNSTVRAILRAFWVRNSKPRFRPKIGLRALLASVSYRAPNPIEPGRKFNLGPLKLTYENPILCLPYIVAESGRGGAVTVAAAHITTLNSAYQHEFGSAFNSMDFAFADGISVVLSARFAAGARVHKVATTDYAPAILERFRAAHGRAARTLVVGGPAGLAASAGRALSNAGLAEIVGTLNGFEEVEEVRSAILSLNPQVVLLGMGMPKEAYLLATWQQEGLGSCLFISCGGWFRLLSGQEARAPLILQQLQLEWLWRLLTDPKRTTRRYFIGIYSIINIILKARRRV